jgi:hypothetical protein
MSDRTEARGFRDVEGSSSEPTLVAPRRSESAVQP